jgi:CRP-like cAMP-binding protein
MRIQNHSAGTRGYSGSLTVVVDSRNEPKPTLDILKQAAMTCPSILEDPAPSSAVMEIKGDRLTYAVYFSTASISSAGEARSQLITQIYKRARPVVAEGASLKSKLAPDSIDSSPIFFFPENDLLHHLSLLESLNDAERTQLSETTIRRHFQVGEQILEQGITVGSAYFISFGVIQGTRQVQDGRLLKLERMGPGDSFGEISLLAGIPSIATLTALTPGLLLQVGSENLRPLLESRPELVQTLSYAAVQLKQSIATLEREAIQSIPIGHLALSARIKKFFHLSVPDGSLTSKMDP